jgi:hypothetical protein
MAEQQSYANLKANFLEWSGGFPPESPAQVTVYIDYAMSAHEDPDVARDVLLEWMQEEPTADQR